LILVSIEFLLGSKWANRDIYFPLIPPRFFAFAPIVASDYRVLIRRIDQESFEPPLEYNEMTRRYPLKQGLSSPVNLVVNIGMVIKENNDFVRNNLIATFEANYLPERVAIDWAIVKYTWSPRESWLRKDRAFNRILEVVYEGRRDGSHE
jgi:hypothetical protein